MLMWIILSSAFIVVFLLVRALFNKKITASAMYILWILVAVRLLIPTYIPVEWNLFSVQNMPSITYQVETVEDNVTNYFAGSDVSTQDTLDATPNTETTIQDNNNSTIVATKTNPIITNIASHPFQFIWILGIFGFGCYFIINNIRFSLRLKRSRILLEDYECKIPVYLVKWLPAPCMTGLIHPAIYVNEQLYEVENPNYVIQHEYMHYRHKDMIWMLMQTILLCIHWFNPLVWIASYLFRKDCEYACDESVAKVLDTEERIAYGRTLLFFETTKRHQNSIFTTATSMSMDGKTMKKRVHAIVDTLPKRILSVVVVCVLVVLLFAGSLIANTYENANSFDNNQKITTNVERTISVEILEAGIFQDSAKCGLVTNTLDNGETVSYIPVSLYYSFWIENNSVNNLNDLEFKIVANEAFEKFMIEKYKVSSEDLNALYNHCDSLLETLSGSSNKIGSLKAQSRSNISFGYTLAKDYDVLKETALIKEENDISNTKDITDYVYDVTLIIYNEGKEISRVDLSTIDGNTTKANVDRELSQSTVEYQLSLRTVGRNDELITSNQITTPPGDLVLSLTEEISEDVANGNVEGDFLEGGIHNAILNIDYTFEKTGRDGTVITASEHIMKDVKSGDKITVTITKELQERLGLTDDQIVITCEGYDSKIIGSWERTSQSIAIGDVPAELAPSEGETETFESTDTFEFREDKTGRWTTTFDEQHSSLNQLIDFTYELEGDQLTLKRLEQNTIGVFTVSFADDHLLLDGRNIVIDLNRIY